jgi:hypothetical protein
MWTAMNQQFYVHQFETVWSFPAAGFRILLEAGARTGEYKLDDPQYHGQRLAGRFSCGRFNDSTGARTFQVPRRFHDAYFISPLDWTREEFREELERFLKKVRYRTSSKRITLYPFTHQMPGGFRTRCCKAPPLVLGDNGAGRHSQRIEWVRCTSCKATGWAGAHAYVPAPNLELLLPWQHDDGTASQT